MFGDSLGLACGFTACRCRAGVVAVAFSIAGAKIFAKDVGRRLASPGPMGGCAFARVIQRLECPGESTGRMARSFSFSLGRSLLLLQRQHSALIGLHLMAAGGESGSSSCGVFSPELGGIPGLSGPRYPLWKVSGSDNESTVGFEVYEHNNECRATEVIGQDWSSEVVALFLEDWELGRVSFELPHDHVPSLPRNEGCMLG